MSLHDTARAYYELAHGHPLDGIDRDDCPECNPPELTHKQEFGRCEDAPCCGCCGNLADDGDTGMTKGDYMELMARDDYDHDMGY